MGKIKLHNAKARQNLQIIVDNSTVKNIKIELDEGGTWAGFDEANALVLPSERRATKIKSNSKKNVTVLSKKQRKHLQSIVDKRKKKASRADLLKKLATVQIPQSELQQYTSISQVKAHGVKKLPTFDKHLARKKEKQDQLNVKKKVSRCIPAKRKLLMEEEKEIKFKRSNPNYIGVNNTDSDENTSSYKDSSEDEHENTSTKDENSLKLASVSVEEPTQSKLQTDSKSGLLLSTTSTKPTLSRKLENERNENLTHPLHKTVYVPVNRTSDVQAARLKLPILAEEQHIMEKINENPVVIIAGETGSGKTTQIPQFLYEAGYAQNKVICITEPRRVAAIAMSNRVAHEMNMSDREISYLIRFEGNVNPATRILFMTDGVLLREMKSNILLPNYSVIILDEAHERSSYTDILVGMLSRIVKLRQKRGNPLKLIIMSATLRVEDFVQNTKLFAIPPPFLNVEARQYHVTVHFQKNTPVDYIKEAYNKTIKIHSRLPDGGILVFVTGQLEVKQLVRKLRHTFPYLKPKAKVTDKKETQQQDEDSNGTTETETTDYVGYDEFDTKRTMSSLWKSKKKKQKLTKSIPLSKVNLDSYELPGYCPEPNIDNIKGRDVNRDNISDGESDIDDNNEFNDDSETIFGDSDIPTTRQSLWVLPLYSLLSTEKQNRIFQQPPEGCRLCVVSTNVAETSLTIPNIKYVVDTGRQKIKLYDKFTGLSAFVVKYTSKASSDQRAGRAGRVSNGHCYRLYSSSIYNDMFPDFNVPDIQKRPVDEIMLMMRSMGIDNVTNFPFPSPPDQVQMLAAEKRLIILGALKPQEICSAKNLPPIVTELGHIAARFPVAPRFGKMLAISHQKKMMPYTICLAAVLSVQEVLIEVGVAKQSDIGSNANKWHLKRKSWAATGNFKLLGDPMVLLRAVGGAEFAAKKNKLQEFCHKNGLRLKSIIEVRKMRAQLTNDINLKIDNANVIVDPELPPPNDKEARFLRQILLAGMSDCVAHKVSLSDICDKEEKRRLKYAYNCLDMEEPVFINPLSVLNDTLPEWIIYQEAYELKNSDTSKIYIRGITAIEPEWLLLYAPQLCNIHDVHSDPAPRYNVNDGKIYCFVTAKFGKAAWELPITEISMPYSSEASSHFGMFLLKGDVCPILRKFKCKLKTSPVSFIKNWSNLHENVLQFKNALVKNKIYSRKTLQEQWAKDKNFLLAEYQNMLYDVNISNIIDIWPPQFAI